MVKVCVELNAAMFKGISQIREREQLISNSEVVRKLLANALEGQGVRNG